jgi:glycyl-tRNA synthetase beta subunit
MFLPPSAKHKFIEDRNGRIRHFVTYIGEEPTTEVTDEDKRRGMTDEDLRQWAQNMGLKIEKKKGLLSRLGL